MYMQTKSSISFYTHGDSVGGGVGGGVGGIGWGVGAGVGLWLGPVGSAVGCLVGRGVRFFPQSGFHAGFHPPPPPHPLGGLPDLLLFQFHLFPPVFHEGPQPVREIGLPEGRGVGWGVDGFDVGGGVVPAGFWKIQKEEREREKIDEWVKISSNITKFDKLMQQLHYERTHWRWIWSWWWRWIWCGISRGLLWSVLWNTRYISYISGSQMM